MRWIWVALVAGALAVGVVIVAAGSDAEVETRPWRELPAPPLSPRERATGFWTGEEVVLVGGSDAPPCPPSASCPPPESPPLADGAAYDPRTDTWRSIAEAPVAFGWATPIVIGSTAYLWIPGEPWRPDAPSAFVAYHVEEDRWEELDLPTQEPDWYGLVRARDRVVAFSHSDEAGGRPDFLFDPASSTWSELPDDPFSPGFDRVMTWDGNELVLFDHELVENPGADLPLRGAAFDFETGEWRIFDDAEAELARTAPRRAEVPELKAVEHAYGGTTEVEAGTDRFVFLGSEWSGADGELHSQAWLWSPRP